MTRSEYKARALAVLTPANKDDPEGVAIYADAYADYQEAQANIDQHGAIVFHPRTGAPIENPYLSVRAKASTVLQKCKLDTTRLWRT
jgi:phage terminase small subunit